MSLIRNVARKKTRITLLFALHTKLHLKNSVPTSTFDPKVIEILLYCCVVKKTDAAHSYQSIHPA